jgi:cytochrome c
LSAIVALSKRLIEDRTMGSKFQKAMAVAAVLAAVGAGLAAGYVIWGWPTNWYAGHDVSTLRPGPEMDLIRYGQQIVGDTARHIGRNATDPAKRYAGNDLACSHCHINSGLKPFGIPLVSTFATFPMMVDEHVMSLAQRINGCMTRSMNGRPLPTDSREMEAIVAYLQFIGRKTPQGVRVAGMGLPPLRAPARAPAPVQGEKVYASQCAKCHKDQGQGAPDGARRRLRNPAALGRRLVQFRRRNEPHRDGSGFHSCQHADRRRLSRADADRTGGMGRGGVCHVEAAPRVARRANEITSEDWRLGLVSSQPPRVFSAVLSPD